ncbi:CLUMA_CG003327, isoform A [Clunio marinus]|uniref:CLUMA_CG003327, isoform A n=1 Tax=Clunio marinus TaxID=568069 RepID=A0A1J1HNB0_9DIPT|nr:CLUMA_CG003327, isoform A [Clunio marinus]
MKRAGKYFSIVLKNEFHGKDFSFVHISYFVHSRKKSYLQIKLHNFFLLRLSKQATSSRGNKCFIVSQNSLHDSFIQDSHKQRNILLHSVTETTKCSGKRYERELLNCSGVCVIPRNKQDQSAKITLRRVSMLRQVSSHKRSNKRRNDYVEEPDYYHNFSRLIKPQSERKKIFHVSCFDEI